MISHYYPPGHNEQEIGRLVNASTTTVDETGSIPVSLEVTEQEEEAWQKMGAIE